MISAAIRYGAVALAAGIAVGLAQFWRYEAHIAGLERDMAKQRVQVAQHQAQDTAQTLAQLEASVRRIRSVADGYAAQQASLSPKIDAILRELRNAPTPLPPDCRPDDLRVRHLRTAIDAANQVGAAAAPR